MTVGRIKAGIHDRIKTRTILALTFGAFLVLYGVLGAGAWELGKQRQDLEADIAFLSRGIGGPIPVGESQQDGMEPALERLGRAFDLFPEQLKVSQAMRGILALADRSNTKVTALQEKTPSTEVVGEHDYFSWPFILEVEGPLENLLDLITRIEHGEEGPMMLQKVWVSRAQETYTSHLEFVFYTRSRPETVPKPERLAEEK